MTPSERPAAASRTAAPPRRGWPYRILTALAALAGTAVALVLAAVLLGAIALATAYPNLPDISGITDYQPKLPLRIYSADGVLLGEFGEERRDFMAIAETPQLMRNAVLAAEDARFYEHGGIDLKGVLRAAIANFSGLGSQGASTITMQVAKNFYLSTEKTLTRKIYEALLAFKIESLLTKDQILELYMNQIYLGQRAYGFAAASEAYFGKPLDKLGVAEAAMLAGLPKAPSTFNPLVNPKRAAERQRYVLDRMQDNGFISAAQREAAQAEQLRYRQPRDVPVHAEYAAETARQLVFAQYGSDAYTLGLNAVLTIDSRDQEVAYRALRSGIMNYERRQFYRGPEAYVELPQDRAEADARIADALAEHPDNDELLAGVAIEVSPKKVVAVLRSGDEASVSGDGLKPVASGLAENGNPKTRIRRGAVIRLAKSAKGEWTITQLPEVEGAFVALDPQTGAVRALVGGFDHSKSKFNRVVQGWRQPGSSFKPFIYSAALERGFTPSTVINDAPLFFDAGATGSQPWEPKNYDGKFEGPMPLRTALAKSKNMVSIRILQAIGPGFAQDWITRFGFDADKHPAYLTMALGAGAVTPMQMARAYAVFANGGYLVEPILIAKVTDDKGGVLASSKLAPPTEAERTLDARNAFVMTSLLQEVTRSGTAASAKVKLHRGDIYGKTGTTNDSMDAWFAGFQRSIVAVVWLGYDTPRKLGDRETGGGLALPIWIDYMSYALRNVPIEEPSAPEGVVNHDGEWYFEEFPRDAGVSSLGLEDKVPEAPSAEEKSSILDIFRR